MSGITQLDELLKSMSPHLQEGEYAFCTVDGKVADYAHLDPVCFFQESEGLTEYDISANVVAGYYHDHIYVPSGKAQLAMNALNEFNESNESNESKVN